MSDNTNSQISKLTGYDFHSYLDGQISDEEFARIEKSVGSHPKVILQMQQCIMIAERFQSLYGEPVNGPLLNSQQLSERRQLQEPALLNDDEYEESEDALVAVEALEIGDKTQAFHADNGGGDIATPVLDNYVVEETQVFDNLAEQQPFDDEQNLVQDYAAEEYVQTTDELYQQGYIDQSNNSFEQEFSDSLRDDYEEAVQRSAAQANRAQEDIQVENLIQGINDVETLSQQRNGSFGGRIHGMKLYTRPDHGWFLNLVHNIKDRIRAKVSLYRYKIQQKRLNKMMGESDIAFDNVPELHNEFDYDIESDIQAQDPPKWQFWKPKAPRLNVADEEYYGDEFNNPFTYKKAGTLAQLQVKAWVVLNKLHIPEQYHNQVLIGLLAAVSFMLGLVLSSKPVALDSSSIVYQAIDAHKYYASRGFETLQQGLPKMNEDLDLLAKIVGSKINLFSLDKTDYQFAGSTLVPTVNGYASMLLLRNRNKQDVSVFITAWTDPELEENRVTCRVPAGISSVCVWQDDEYYYVVSSDITLSRVRSFAESLALQRHR